MRELPPEFKRRFLIVFVFLAFCAVVGLLSLYADAQGCEAKQYREQYPLEMRK